MIRRVLKTAFIVTLTMLGLVVLSGTCVVCCIQNFVDTAGDERDNIFIVGEQPHLVIRDRSHLTSSITIEKNGKKGTIHTNVSSYKTRINGNLGYIVFQDGDTVRIETKPTDLWPRLNPFHNSVIYMWIIVPEETVLDIKSDHAKVIMR